MTQPSLAEEPTPDQDRQETARRYARIRRRLAMIELALTGILLLLLVFSNLSRIITARLILPVVPAATIYAVAMMVVYGILTAPLDYYTGYVLPRRYGLSIQKFPAWLNDELRGKGLGLALGAGMTALVYWFISSFPQTWWLLTWGVAVTGSLIITHLAPIIIVPIFLKMKPLGDTELKARLEQLAQKAGVRVRGVYTLELSRRATTANAALMGLGNTRRIVLTDTLLPKYSPEEIEVIVAHELGHHRHRDIPASFIMQSAVMLLGLYLASLALNSGATTLGFRGITDIAALPLLMLVLAAFGLITMPVANAFQRHREAAADEYALRLSDNPKAFISMMTKLTDQNLSEAQPPRWVEVLMYDHPSYHQRVQYARRYSQRRGAG